MTRITRFLLIYLCIIAHCCINAQNVGQFPYMNGGFDNEANSTLQVYSIPSNGNSTHWTTTSANGQNTVVRQNGRSSPGFLRTNLISSNYKILQTPSVKEEGSAGTLGSIKNETPYIVQLYYRTWSKTNPASGKRLAIGTDGSQSNNAVSVTLSATNGSWKKVFAKIISTSSSAYPRYGIGMFQYSGSDTVDIDIDDFVVYAASQIDTSAPGVPINAQIIETHSNSLWLSWSAPPSGIDTGGYMVVRGTSDPNQVLNVNGVYYTGNEIAPGQMVVYEGKDTTFSDTGLTSSATYYYRIYSIDKAFNYSAGVLLTGNTKGSGKIEITAIPQGLYDVDQNKLRMTDTCTVYLARYTSPYNFIDSARCIIDSLTFTGTGIFSNAPDGNYFLVIKHRNSVETWSNENGFSFMQGTSMHYDFTISNDRAFGSNLIKIGNRYCLFSGDVNQDGYIDPLDMSLIDLDSFNYRNGYIVTDVNGDGYVDPLDMSVADVNSFNYIGVKKPQVLKLHKK